MAKGALTIRRQIRSIGNTKKMTKAMELVSAAKMRRSVSSVQATRPYAEAAHELIRSLAPRVERDLHPLLAVRPLRRVGMIIISTNRGLCGGFNNAVVLAAHQRVQMLREQGVEQVSFFTHGKRGRDLCARYGYSIEADYPKKDITTSVMDTAPVSYAVMRAFEEGTLDAIYLVYMRFISSVRQVPTIVNLLPFSLEEEVLQTDSAPFLFEPSDQQVLQYVVPRLIDTAVFQAVLESEASEHSARMLAMHNASEAATDMLTDLRLTYNQARQASITQEIAEISSGKAALE